MVNNSPAAMSTEKRNSHPDVREYRLQGARVFDREQTNSDRMTPDQVSIQVELFAAGVRRTCSTHRAIKSVYSTKSKRGSRWRVREQNRSEGER